MRVLLAEDNLVNQAVIKGMLEFAGHQVDAVINGQAALQALEKTPYDLVIMDCLMPQMDGFEATRRIRASSGSGFDPNIPILAVTALASDEDRWKCMDAGMTGYISKPVKARELLASITALCRVSPESAAGKPAGKTQAKQSISQSDLLLKMSPLLLQDAEQWQVELRQLDGENRLGELGALAHKIRGTADVMGFHKLSRFAAKLEKTAKMGWKEEASLQADELIMELQSLILKIQTNGQ